MSSTFTENLLILPNDKMPQELKDTMRAPAYQGFCKPIELSA